MPKLSELIAEYGANAFIYSDEGSGAGFPRDGQALDYDDDAAADYGETELTKLAAPLKSADGHEIHFASEWVVTGDGDNPYRYRIMF